MLDSRRFKRNLASLVGVALALAGCGSGEIKSDPGVPGVPGRVQEEERSPVLATILAVFPGIVLHGLGNLYAGNTEKAEDLMAEEGLSVVAMGASAGLTYLAYAENGHAEHSHGAEKVYGRFEEASEYLGGGVLGVIGVGAFFHSWIKDVIDAGSSAEAHNREVRRQYDEQIRPVQPDKSLPPRWPAGAPSKQAQASQPASDGPLVPGPGDGTVPPDAAVAPVGSPSLVPAHPGNR